MKRQSAITTRDLECILLDKMAEPKALPLSLLEEITNCFSDEQQIGSGAFSVVYKGNLENSTVAVKRMSNTYMYEKEFQREVECLMMARHKNVVRFLGYCADTQGNVARHEGKFVMADVQQRLLCFEYHPKGSLHEYINDRSCRLQWRQRYQIIRGICQGLHYLHQKNIVHLDLKPANILLDDNWVPKITDFGISRCFHEMQSQVITRIAGTPGYLAPESFNHTEVTYRHSYRLDIYSLGVVIMEIITGKKGYHDVDKVVKSWSSLLEESHREVQLEQVRVCTEIGIECTNFNPAKRPNTQDIISRLSETESMEERTETGVITPQQTEHVPNELPQPEVNDRLNEWWELRNSPEYPDAEFQRDFRMGRGTFFMLCDALGAAVDKVDTALQTAIPVPQRVAVCVWCLATGEPLRLVPMRFGIGMSTCHKIVLDVCSAIHTVLMPRFLQWPGVPGVVGAMCTTHVPIIAPKASVDAYFNWRHTERNQKTSYSITLQGVVSPDGAFTDVCIGWPGSMSYEQVLDKSALQQRAAAGMLAGSWVVGGASYPLTDWLLVPYTHQNLTWRQQNFNEKLGELRQMAVKAFTRLKGRWACLQKPMQVELQDLPMVVGACCVLHNICEARGEPIAPELLIDLQVDIGDDETVLENPVRSEAAAKARDKTAHNLLHGGLDGTASSDRNRFVRRLRRRTVSTNLALAI